MEALPDELLHRVIDRMPVARLAVTTTTDAPDAMPIVFARVGRTLFSPIDGKPKKSARPARLAHIAKHPAVTLVLDHYDEDWSRLWWIRLGGEAVIAEGEHRDWDAGVQALQLKYPQYATTPMFKGEPVMIALAWARVRWWAPGGRAGFERWLEAEP